VLKRIDSFLAWLTWVAALLVVVMLIVGPKVIAEDKGTKQVYSAQPASDSGGAAPDGKAVFTGNCGSCHTLKAAGTSGQVGPRLDGISLSPSQIEGIVRSGRGGMPSFGGRLSGAEISAVAAFVAGQH
jgi:mono/diheme cytochrome c family protein